MSRRKPAAFSNVQYSHLDCDDFTDSQFKVPSNSSPIPWKAISLAILLFVAGLIMLVVGSLIVGGIIDTKYQDRMWPLIILGALMFIPGAYHVRIAYCAYNKLPGYSFEDIPEFE